MPLGEVVSIEQAHGDKPPVEIGEQTDFGVALHGFLNGDCCLQDFDIVFRVVEVDCVLDVDQRMGFHIESRHDTYLPVG